MEEKEVENEKRKTQLSLWLDNVDDKAEAHGEMHKTIWQFIKFSAVSTIVTIIQLALVNLMYFLMKDWTDPLPGFLSVIFSEDTMGSGKSNWGYILPFFLSNFIANSVGYFLNRHRTFKSDAPWWHYVLYIGVLFGLILFSTWFQGLAVKIMLGWNWEEWIVPTLAMSLAGFIQFVILFPLQKFVLLREKKKEITEENNNG